VYADNDTDDDEVCANNTSARALPMFAATRVGKRSYAVANARSTCTGFIVVVRVCLCVFLFLCVRCCWCGCVL
jgi:hypothetical protein